MGAVASKTVADLRRRRLQTIVLAVVLFLGAGAATLALSILVETNEPFDHAFAAANGAHLVIDYDAAVSDAQLAATKAASGVTSSAGPWPVTLAWRGREARPDRQPGRVRTAHAGRHDRPGDHLAGRWWQAPGEIVLDQDTAALLGTGIGGSVPLYAQPAFAGKGAEKAAPGGPTLVPPGQGQSAAPPEPARTLTVVGIAASVSTPDVAAWMSPTDLRGADAPTRNPLRRCSIASIHRALPPTSSAAVGRITSTSRRTRW